MNRRVLITGARGFIGRSVCKIYADNGWVVHGLGHGRWDEQDRKGFGVSSWLEADVSLASLSALTEPPELIVHCAGGSSVGASLAQPHRDFERTVSSLASVLEFARTSGRRPKIIFISSAAVYGAAERLPILEYASRRPVSPYGVHKSMGEDLCSLYCKEYGIEIAVLRLFSVGGERLKKQLLWDACNKIVRNDMTFYGTGHETRDWIHVSDASRLIFLAHRHVSGDCTTVNVGTGVPVTNEQVLRLLAKELGCETPPIFNGETRLGDPTDYQADVTLASSWGWQPQNTWVDIVQEYTAWFLGGHHD